MVEYPPGEPQDTCAICDRPFECYDPEFTSQYANLVCESCDERAVTKDTEKLKTGNEYLGEETIIDDNRDGLTLRMAPDVGDNPVFIDGQKCWRRYRFGGWVTRQDDHDCDSVMEFHETHRDDV
jgi:DNA-directed RNA polymerase subunit RPC12/RpoP